MKNHSFTGASALVAVAIVVLGFLLKGGLDNYTYRDRVVNVRGLCEREVMANKVTWPIVTKEVGNDLPAIYTRIDRCNQAIVAFLKGKGLQESEISVRPPQVYDYAAERYSNQDIRFRYQVTNVVVVTSGKVEEVRRMISEQTELLRQGIAIVDGDYSYPISYEYTALNDIKPEMIAEATANARDAADKFAADSHSRLGKIKTASQGQFSIENRDIYTPERKTVRVVAYITYFLDR
ncbi:MAG: SIMPL domain-containing protein [Bacteroidales bacterium]|nr:SIMPL domain-containing protein [Bacteroidales bacterium]MDE7072174.1 SIMPL domain-containing protein [Bacteroidales bacterium]